MMLPNASARSWDELNREFRWEVPERFNIGHVCCGRWAEDRARFALYYEDEAGHREAWTFWEIQREANRLANVLAAMGVMAGDRVALLLPQRPETAVAHVACQQMGVIAVPLTPHVAPDRLESRLVHAGARVALVDPLALPTLAEVRPRLPALRQVIGVGGARESWIREWDRLLPLAATRYTPRDTAAGDAAMILHDRDTDAADLGVVMAQRSLEGALPGFICAHGFYPAPGDMFWSPADWGESEGLFGGLLPAWSLGQPVLGYRGDIDLDPDRAGWLMERYGVKNLFLPAANFAAMMTAQARPREKFALAPRTVVVAGGALSDAALDWGREQFGVGITGLVSGAGMNNIVGDCPPCHGPRPGAYGRAYPGHRLEIIDAGGQPAAIGEVGELCVQHSCNGVADPVFFSAYWNAPEATRARFFGTGSLAWGRTGLRARQDEAGYFQYPDQTAATEI